MVNETQGSDESLMVRVKGGDHQAFATLVSRHTGKFYAAAYRMCGHADEAGDIVQDAFLKLWQKPELWDPKRGAKFTTWFYRVVTNQALDHMRRKRPQSSAEVLDYMPDGRLTQEQDLQLREQQAVLEAAIQALPERQKAALNLCVYEEMSNKDAADILGVGVKALESLLMRAKAGLRDELIRKGFIDKEKKYG
jgi:RNA polymerase sigma-70 factor (ECF subfamily)